MNSFSSQATGNREEGMEILLINCSNGFPITKNFHLLKVKKAESFDALSASLNQRSATPS